jgi:hypothetical protein
MKRSDMPVHTWPQQAGAWVVDYDAARAQAIRWLGDRYLLARPINRNYGGRHPAEEAAFATGGRTSGQELPLAELSVNAVAERRRQ